MTESLISYYSDGIVYLTGEEKIDSKIRQERSEEIPPTKPRETPKPKATSNSKGGARQGDEKIPKGSQKQNRESGSQVTYTLK